MYEFLRYGVRPEWLLVHRILSHKHLRDGRMMYLVKWRDLPYNLATWEHENLEYTDIKSFIDYYWVNKNILFFISIILFIEKKYNYTLGITSIL